MYIDIIIGVDATLGLVWNIISQSDLRHRLNTNTKGCIVSQKRYAYRQRLYICRVYTYYYYYFI